MCRTPCLISAIFLLVGFHAIPVNAANWSLETHWGGRGTGPAEFQDPRALAFGPNNNVYIADYGNARIQQFDENGGFVRAWGQSGDPTVRFDYLKGITVDNDGNVYVLNGHSLAKFTSDGQLLTKTDPLEYVYGYNLATSADNTIYTVGSSSLVAYNSSLAEISRHDVAGCTEDSYGGITIADQRIFVTDVYCQAVDVYSKPGDRLNHWTFAGLSNPYSIVELNRQLFVTSPTERAIRIFSIDGVELGNILIPQIAGETVHPLAVAARGDRLYVLAGDYVLKFSEQTAVEETSWTLMKQSYQ